jgi:dTDP-glucose 4,6-dehydratase
MLRNVAIAKYPDFARPERFNIVGGKQISNLDITLWISKIIGKKAVYEMVDSETSRPGHDKFYGLSGEKLKDYGHTFPKNLEESFEKTIKWYVDNPRWLR